MMAEEWGGERVERAREGERGSAAVENYTIRPPLFPAQSMRHSVRRHSAGGFIAARVLDVKVSGGRHGTDQCVCPPSMRGAAEACHKE